MGTKKVQRVIKKTFEICPTAFPYFIPKKAKEGYVKNRWRNWSTYAYLS